MISYHSFSQCSYTSGVGCSLSITAPLTITGTPTWTGTVCVDDDVISGIYVVRLLEDNKNIFTDNLLILK